MRAIGNLCRKAATAALACALNFPLGAQEQAPRAARENASGYRQAGLSELEKENLGRVAASASQVIEVLQKDAGLLLELKRWAAKDATDHGQMVSDADLTDQAIFDRLAAEVEFRSFATRLVERYGYLVPKPSPGSEAAREQEVVLEERLRQLRMQVRALEQREETTAVPKETQEPRPQQKARGIPATGPALDALPLSSSPLPAILEPSTEPPLRAPQSLTLASASAGLGSSRDLSEVTRPDGSWEATARSERSAMYAELGERATTSSLPSEVAGSRAGKPGPGLSAAREKSGAGDLRGMVGRPNPFGDIPSLYDMYAQVSPRPTKLARFGTEVFRNGPGGSDLLPMDLPVGPEYVVGPGDGLAIDLWGGVSQRLYRIVDRQGRLALPEAGPVLVSGRTLGEVQEEVQHTLRTQFRDISVDVSLSRLRTVRVYVVGDVERPGAYDVSSLSTPLNAFFEARGPTSQGSLRILKHYRGKQLVEDVDVYALLLHGVKSDMARLENGDTVLVPPIGPQVTVEGMARRPAVYEIRGEKTLAEVLELAGGILPSATLRHIEVQRLAAHEKRTMLSLNIADVRDTEAVRQQLESFVIQDGDDVNIFPIAPYNQDAVYLEGHVLRPGRYSYRPGMKLTDLVSSYEDLLPEPAEKYAEIIRLNPPDYRPSVMSLELAAALANPAAAAALQPLDTVRIFSRYDFQNPPLVSVGGAVRKPGTYRTAGQIRLSDAIHLAGGLTADALTADAQVFRYQPDSTVKITSVNLNKALAGNPLDNLLLEPRDRVLVHRNPAKIDPASVYIRGEVAKPGRYPLTTNLHVGDLIRLAGGLKRSADTGMADLTRFVVQGQKQAQGEHLEIQIAAALAGDPSGDIPLRDGDVLAIRQVPGWNEIGATVTVGGEVNHPGTYGIKPGERLSSLLKRTGGFLPTAYPQGIVFERVSVRELQQKSRQELIQRIEQEAGSVKASGQQSSQEQLASQQAVLEQRRRQIEALEKAPVTGRMVVRLRSNLAEFEKSPDNVELRGGDSIVIPKRPSFVLVTGQVYNSNAITYKPGKNAHWYLRQAGGTTEQANKKATFIVRANGSVVSGKGDWWSGGALSTQIEPGDMIVVPEKAIGGSAAWKNLLSVAQLAESASIAALVVTR